MAKLSGFFQAFGFMFNAIRHKRREMLISLVMVLILLLIASTLMYFVEHNAQPKEFSSIPAAMWWAVATLTTVGYGDVAPITDLGKVLGGVIAILGVGLVALPAGIIAAGFIEEIEKDKKLKQLKKQEEILRHAFSVEYYYPVKKIKEELKVDHLPRKWLTMNDIKYKIGMTEESVLEVVGFSNLFRMRNVKLGDKQSIGLEFIQSNRSYGQCIDRKSRLTIINLFSYIQPYYGHFSMGLADLLGANFISNEMYNSDSFLKERQLNLIHNDDYMGLTDTHPALTEFKKDVKSLIGKEEVCIFLVNALPNDKMFHFNIGADQGDAGFEKGRFFKDKERLQKVYDKAVVLAESKEKVVLTHEMHGKQDPNHASWWIHKETGCNLIMLHINVLVLKGKLSTYYAFMRDLAACLEDLK